MLELTAEGIKKSGDWENLKIELPGFNIDDMIEKTKRQPAWVHFGGGNIFRAFIANLQQEILNQKKADTGIIVVESYDEEIIDKIYTPHDNLSLLVLMSPKGDLKKRVIGSVAESLVGDPKRAQDWGRVKQIFKEPSLQIVSFTISEKGYNLTTSSGEYTEEVKRDFGNGPAKPVNVMSKIASLAYTRYLAGGYPIAFVSMDNCSRNGEKLSKAVGKIAEKWRENGFVDVAFINYLNDSSRVSFPWSMIDKITPRPSESVGTLLDKDGIEDIGILCTTKKTYIAPFVNTEIPQYLVVENCFPNGRMPLELVGVLFADRETVQKVEKMKVTTCLNPLHTALAVFGCILGYKTIAGEMVDSQLKKLVERIGYDEGMPVVVNPGIIDPKKYLHEVLEQRFPNVNIPDTPQRIATDTSEKLSIRFGETIKSYCSNQDLDAKDLKYIPLAITGWCRYLLGLNDLGEKMELSFDPMMEELKGYLKGIEFGNPLSVGDKLKPILSNQKLFGVNLYDVGLGEKIEGFLKEMIAGKDAVRNILVKYVQ
jgi:fructuronate reductase